MEVLREKEFAPVKNANESNFDTPESGRLLVLKDGRFLTYYVPLYATGNSKKQTVNEKCHTHIQNN